jgi:hypothetical protein
MTFEDLDIGDVFIHINGSIKFVKLSSLKENNKPIPKRLPNALNLTDNHYVVIGQTYQVKRIKSITDFSEDKE